MRLNSCFFKAVLLFLILACTNSRADNPSNLFGIALGQDVFELSSIEKLGSASMKFKIIPINPMTPFDLYSIEADNNFRVQSIYAMAKVSSEQCESELKNMVNQIEASLGVTFTETIEKKKSIFISEDDKSVLVISCNRYRKYREKQLKDIVFVLGSKARALSSSEVDKVKSRKMSEIINRNRVKKREVELEMNHDFSGQWSLDCSDNNATIGIHKLRENFYHFLVCSTAKCINLPGITSDNVEVVGLKHLNIAGQPYELCTKM